MRTKILIVDENSGAPFGMYHDEGILHVGGPKIAIDSVDFFLSLFDIAPTDRTTSISRFHWHIPCPHSTWVRICIQVKSGTVSPDFTASFVQRFGRLMR